MRALIILILLGMSAVAADTGLRLVSTVTTTNGMGVTTRETFTRGGQTNLIRQTTLQSNRVVSLDHEFFHRGRSVGVMTGSSTPGTLHLRDGLPCQISVNFSPSKDIHSLHINSKDFTEAYFATNGAFYPAPDAYLGNSSFQK